MFKNILAIFANIGIIFSLIFSIGDAKIHHRNGLLPKLGLIISVLSLVYHILSIFNKSKEVDHEDQMLDKLF